MSVHFRMEICALYPKTVVKKTTSKTISYMYSFSFRLEENRLTFLQFIVIFWEKKYSSVPCYYSGIYIYMHVYVLAFIKKHLSQKRFAPTM